MRTSIALLIVAALCAVATGCGSSKSSSKSSSSSAGGSAGGPTGAGQTLHVYGFGTGDEIANTRAALASKAVAPAKVANPSGGFSDQQFLTQVASHNPPDVVYMDRQKVGQYAAKGALQPVSVCGIDMSQYRKPAVSEVTYDGKVYGVPEFYSTRTIFMDDRVLRKAGVAKFDIADWNKLKVEAKKVAIVSGGKVKRIGFDPKIDAFLPLWAKANGADLISSDGKKAQLDDPKVVQALQYAVSLINEQGGWNAFKAFRDTWDFFGGGNEFVKDQVGGFPIEDFYIGVLEPYTKKVQMSFEPFTDRQGNPISWETGSAWAIPKGAKHVKLACEWAKTMTETSSWIAAAKARIAIDKKNGTPFTGLFTANTQADDQINNKLYKPGNTQFDKAAKLVESLQDKAFYIPASAAGAQVNTAYTSAVTRVLSGQQSAAQALKQAQHEAQQALDSASVPGG
jgi:multiple sugar transport system substrate-binding protein